MKHPKSCDRVSPLTLQPKRSKSHNTVLEHPRVATRWWRRADNERLALGSMWLASARSVHIALVVHSWSFETHTHTRSHVGARRQTHHVKLSYRIEKKIKIKRWGGRAGVSWRGCTNVPHWWMFRNCTTLRKSPWKSCEGRGWSPPKFRSGTCPPRMPAAWRLVPHRFQRPDVWTHEM